MKVFTVQRSSNGDFLEAILSDFQVCDSNIEMAPLCKIDVTLPRVLGPRGLRRGGVVDEQAGVQPSRRAVAGSVGSAACQRRPRADWPTAASSVSSAARPQEKRAWQLLSKRLGKPSNHRLPAEVRTLRWRSCASNTHQPRRRRDCLGRAGANRRLGARLV